ncbi:Histone deacetylase hda1 [Ascosphaera pollenicola]|nr:Histone deacetylase hda1 [Ascosphaera pollenicola]
MESDHDIVMGEGDPLTVENLHVDRRTEMRGSSMSLDVDIQRSAFSSNRPHGSDPESDDVSTVTATRIARSLPRPNLAVTKMDRLDEQPFIIYSSEDEDSDGSFDEDHAFLPKASLPSGLCYDPRMRYHCEVKPETDVHPEDPRRIYYIYKEICKAGLVDDPTSTQPLVKQPLQRIDARVATVDEITKVHTPEHFQFVKSTQHMTEDELKYLEEHRDSIYFNNLTFVSSLLSCGGAIETCRAVIMGKVKNAIGVIRPPGHHAEHDKTMGFCVFNNVSVATRVCQKEFGERCRKVLILDWDVHHGNGTQEAFYDDPNVLYMSLHVFRNGTFYPGGDDGDYDHCGEGNGLGRNVNIPWPLQGMGDGDYLYAFQQVIMPIAYEFDPDFVIISAGFDAAAGDELGGCFVTPPCYAHMTHMLMNLAGAGTQAYACLEIAADQHRRSEQISFEATLTQGECNANPGQEEARPDRGSA